MTTRNLGRSLRALLPLLAVIGVIRATPALRWRAAVVFRKGLGQLPELSWVELLSMLRPRSGVWLERLAETPNPYLVISNPHRGAADVAAGQHLFRTQCMSCHREGGTGPGPDLSRGVFTHGPSDWALYRNVRRGIPHTAMPAHAWPARDIWQVVAYVQTLGRAKETAIDSSASDPPAPQVSFAALLAGERDSSDWQTYSGSYASHRYSRLQQIDRSNVSRLHLRWIYQLPMGTEEIAEASPLAVANVLYVTHPPSDVAAVDGLTGEPLWTYHHELPDNLPGCCGRVNRGVAILGNTIYVATYDAHLVALDAGTGKVRWETTVADPADGYSITAAPLALDGLVITGVAGGDFGVRGFLDAYDATTGKRVWRLYTIPAPGERGHETWSGDSWRQGGGATWMTGSYDPALGLLYWGTGNPGPDFDGTGRPGNNLFANSLLAIEARTGKLRWYFQFTPHDVLDYDAVEVPVLVNADSAGHDQRLVVTANRNGFYYVLDRATGRFLAGRPYARVTWTPGLDATGHPLPTSGAEPSREGTLLYPNAGGATNWWPPAFSPRTNLLYVATAEHPSIFYSSPSPYKRGARYYGGDEGHVPNGKAAALVRALSATSGMLRWEHALAFPQGHLGGLLATAGDLVLGGNQTRFYALDAETGQELWQFDAGGRIAAAPIAYQVDGRECISVLAGRALLTFSLDSR